MTDTRRDTQQELPRWRMILRALWNTTRHNLFFKLLALAFAIIIWAFVIAQDNSIPRPKDDETMKNIPVSVQGEATLLSRGLMITGCTVNGQPADYRRLRVDLEAEVPQLKYGEATGGVYEPQLRLAAITEAGESVELAIMTTQSEEWGSAKAFPASVILTVEPVATRTVSVMADTSGSLERGCITNPSPSAQIVGVRGPASAVEKIGYVGVTLDLSSIDVSGLTGFRQGTHNCRCEYYAQDGSPLDSANLEILLNGSSVRDIPVVFTLMPDKDIAVSPERLVTGEPAKGYKVESITVEPSSFAVAGRSTVLNRVDMFYQTGLLSVEGASQDVTGAVTLSLTGGLVFADDCIARDSDSSDATEETVLVTAHIVPAPRVLPGLLVSAPSGAEVEPSAVDVTLSGPRETLNAVTPESVILWVDTAGLEPGVHEVRVQSLVSGAEGIAITCEPETVTVTVPQ